MELRRYLRIAWRRKWLILPTFLLTMAAAAAFVLPKPWVYESTATWLIRPRILVSNGDIIDAADVLNRTVNLPASFATVARSDKIKDEAIEQLGPSVDVSGTSVSAEIVTSTTILSVTVSGPHPEANAALADAVGSRATAFVNTLGTPFVMTPLDAAEPSRTPVGPNKKLTIAVGGLLGIALGMAFAMLAEHLRRAREAEEAAESGEAEPLVRGWLRWQRVEADRSRRPFSVGVIRVLTGPPADGEMPAVSPPDREHVRRVRGLLRLAVPDEVAVAYHGDGDFVLIVPGTELILARDLVERVQAGLSLLLDGAAVYVSSGACGYENGRLEGDAWVVRAVRELLGGDGSGDRPEPGSGSDPDGGSGIFDVEEVTIDAASDAMREPSRTSGRRRR